MHSISVHRCVGGTAQTNTQCACVNVCYFLFLYQSHVRSVHIWVDVSRGDTIVLTDYYTRISFGAIRVPTTCMQVCIYFAQL